MNTKIAVLLTCHNRREKTMACLQALYNCSLPRNHILDVFLVDDGSTDGTTDVAKANYPMVNLIRGNGQLFWNRGMRLAWETAASTLDFNYFLWLNDDTILISQAIELLVRQAQNYNNEKIMIGATCSGTNGEYTYGGYKFYSEKIIPNGEWQKCDYFNGNIVLIPSYVFQKVGFLDIRFSHALGDFDYGRRAGKLGFVHLVAPIYLGYCERHEKIPLWIDKSIKLSERLKILYSPLGNNPFEFFLMDRRQYGILSAFFHFITLHLRTIFPQIWIKLNKSQT